MQLGKRRLVLLHLAVLAAAAACTLPRVCHAIAASEADASDAPRRSPLQVRLVGIALGTSGTSMCVIEDLGEGQRQALYKVGDAVQEDVRIERIEWQRVILTRDGEEEVLELAPGYRLAGSQDSTGTDVPLSRLPIGHLQCVGENQFVVDRTEFEQVLQVAMAQFPQQVHAEPYYESDRLIGYRVSAVHPGGLFAQIGLRDGDVVRRLNSADFSNPYNGGGFPDLRSVPELTVEILRGAETQVLRYRFR